MKPTVFKMAGSWIWQCHHADDRGFGGDYPPAAWRHPWDACLSAAHLHHVQYHTEVKPLTLDS